jgi:hypothetical protein
MWLFIITVALLVAWCAYFGGTIDLGKPPDGGPLG